MSGIFGHLNLSDTDRVFNATVGQAVIYEAAQEYLDRVNMEIARVLSAFVERTTSDYKLRYKLPGGGYLQRRGSDGRYGATKAYGAWDVAFPLEDFGAQIASNDVDRAYMTVAELDRHINTVVIQNVNTVRFELLVALLNNAQGTFVDPLWGSLSIEPLANGDTVTYPPVLGATSEATDNHYLGSAYTAASISDTNDPFVTIVDELEEHFGASQGGSNIVVFINNAQRGVTEDLVDFVEVPDQYVRVGTNTDVPQGLPTVPGRIIGRHGHGAWISEWRHIPASYMVGLHLEAEAPLIRRIDPADTGLGDGLQLVATDEEFPFEESFWRHRFGLGCGNRLNGVVMDMSNADSDYDIPTGYS
jgi:hypothetical protein